MKKIMLSLAALAMGSLLTAQTTTEPTTGSLVVTSAVTSQYMFRGARLGGTSFQPSMEYGRGSIVAGLWTNFPLQDKVVGQSAPEFDFYGSYSLEVAKDMTVVPGVTFYTYPNAVKLNGFYKGTFEPNIAFNYTIGGLKLTPKLYYDLVVKGPTAELTAAFSVPLAAIASELSFTATVGTFKLTDYAPNNTPNIKNWGDYYLLGLAMPFQVSKTSKITVGWSYSAGSNNFLKQGSQGKTVNTAAIGRGFATVGYTITY
jgi:uncharacterized protein (TIGR02001 family)